MISLKWGVSRAARLARFDQRGHALQRRLDLIALPCLHGVFRHENDHSLLRSPAPGARTGA
jgi:hypothetical protein